MTKPKYELRPYQGDLVARSLSSLHSGKSVLLQLPTGGGKTTIAADIVQSFIAEALSVWFVCHRREILDQAHAELTALGIEAGILSPRYKPDPNALVQVCSVNALPRRIAKVRPPRLIIWDECHHMASPSWSALCEQFPDAYHLGLTATPERMDKAPLSPWFDDLIVGPSSSELIDAGWLSKFRIFAPTIPDMRGVRATKKDYQKADLTAVMDKAALVGDVVDHYQRITPDARALVFAVSVGASQRVVDRFRAASIPAAHIDASTPPDERKASIDDLATGRIKVLSNVEIFTEGFDCPAVDAVILLRPTRSLALYLQMIGRGLRTFAGKPKTVILDHSGLVHRHGMPDDPIEWSLDGEVRREGLGGSRLRRCPECSSVHEWAAECVECGHAYGAADRSIDEVYGELTEIRRRRASPLSGHETIWQFAKRCGVSPNAIEHRIKMGMPASECRQIPVKAALAWLEDRPLRRVVSTKGAEPGSETPAAFAKRFGLRLGTVKAMITKGLPTTVSGCIRIEVGGAWVRANPPRSGGNGMLNVIDGCMRRSVFAERARVSSKMLYQYIQDGLPVEGNGYINVERGLAWLSEYNATRARKKAA